MSDIIISQSFIKAMDEEKKVCPTKAKAIYIEGIQGGFSEAMNTGNYFETVLLGAPEDGIPVQMKRNANGEKGVDQQRVEWHASNMKRHIMPEFAMDFHSPRKQIWIQLKPGYKLRARMDMVSSMKMPDGTVLPNVILDFKITGSILSSFPADYAWGLPHIMDHLQAQVYSWAWYMQNKEWIPFFYIVMDTSPQRQWKIVGGMIQPLQIKEMKERIRKTIADIEHYNATGWPLVPSYDNCRYCPLKEMCPAYKQGKDIQVIW